MVAKPTNYLQSGTSAKTGKAEPKQRRNGKLTRANILSATRGLIERYGFNTVTLDKVADTVGISKSSILWHFGKKENLLTESVLLVIGGLEAALDPDGQQHLSTEKKIERLLRVVADYFTNASNVKGVIFSLVFSRQTPPKLRDRLVEQYRSETQKLSDYLESTSCPRAMADNLAAALIVLINGSYVQWHMDDYKMCFHDVLLRAYETFRLER